MYEPTSILCMISDPVSTPPFYLHHFLNTLPDVKVTYFLTVNTAYPLLTNVSDYFKHFSIIIVTAIKVK